MLRYVAMRVAQGLVTLWLVATVVFLLMNVIGNPILGLLPDGYTQQEYDQLNHQLGYDRPMPVRYVEFIIGGLHGDFGDSVIYQQPAMSMALDRLPFTAKLATSAVLLGVLVGIPVGLLAGYRPRSLLDRLSVVLATSGLAVPNFVVGIFLILIFGVALRWLPVAGSMDDFQHAILPVATLSLWTMGALVRFERSAARETMSRPHIVLARAKGLPEWRVLTDHVLKNGMLSVLTFGALQFGVLLGGSVVIESVFGMPGLGRLALESVERRDTFLVEAVVMLAATSFIVINLLTDLLYTWLDPRIRLTRHN